MRRRLQPNPSNSSGKGMWSQQEELWSACCWHQTVISGPESPFFFFFLNSLSSLVNIKAFACVRLSSMASHTRLKQNKHLLHAAAEFSWAGRLVGWWTDLSKAGIIWALLMQKKKKKVDHTSISHSLGTTKTQKSEWCTEFMG